jgi:putative peptidoglycan lipid II flippase
MYTHTSHLSSSNQLDKLARLLNKAVRILLFLSIPLTCLVIELRDPLLKCVFQHGRFDAGSVAGTSTVLMVYALGLITLSLEGLMVHSFFALRDTKTPTMIGIVCVVIRVILAIAFLTHFQYLAIAGALVVSKTIKLAVLGSLLRRRLKGLVDVHIVRFLLKTLFATFLLWCTLRLFSGFSAADSWGQTALLRLLLPAAAGVLSFVLSSYFLKIEELWTILSMTVLKNTRTDSWEQKHDG